MKAEQSSENIDIASCLLQYAK